MRECLRCGHKGGRENPITRDHIVPKSVLRLLLDIDEYQVFSTQARYCNIQPLCASCNNKKGWKAIDYRTPEDQKELLDLLCEWGLEVDWIEDFDE